MIRTEMITKKAARWSLLAAAFFFAGCSSTYNEYYEDEHLPTDNVTNSESYVTFTKEIIPTLSDPLYEIKKTRGGGPFDPYSLDEERWLKAPFHVFALLTSNKESERNSEKIDYRLADDKHRLLWDQAYYMDDATGRGHFYSDYVKNPTNEVHKYYHGHKDYRYKFFLFHTDDAVLSNRQVNEKNVTCDVTLDGTQDLMHSFAYHTHEEYNRAIAQLPNDPPTIAFLQGNMPEGPVENRFIYSGMSGNRGIHPIFNLNHLLTRLQINVRGATSPLNETDDYMFVLIDKVEVQAPNGGTLVVANDEWERDSYIDKVNNDYRSIFKPFEYPDPDVNPMPYLKSEVPNCPMRDSENIPGLNVDFKKLDEEYNTTTLSDGTKLYDGRPYHHVNSAEFSRPLCKDMMLPPMTSYKVHLEGRFLYTHEGDDNMLHLGRDGILSGLKTDYCFEMDDLYFDIQPKDESGNDVDFLPGRKYVVNLYVYGPGEIKLEIKLRPWEAWGNPIDEGKDNNFSGDGYE